MSRPNIIVIAVDTLRSDHLGCYDYQRATSPNIDRLAREGTVFENVFVNNFPTTPSFTTLYTGVDGIEHSIVQHSGKAQRTLSPRIPVLSERLRQAGYTTAAVDNLVTLRQGLPSWFARGFDHYLGFRYDPADDTQAGYVTNRGLALLEQLRSDRFFLLLHYWDPHVPYWPPSDAHIFKVDPEETRTDAPSLRETFERSGDESSSLLLRSMLMGEVRNYDYVVSQYDEAIWNIDREIGRILQRLDELDLTRETLVVLLADHGECFGEFGVHFDHTGPADANSRVPLILRLPGEVSAGRRVHELVQTVDITATLLEAAGVQSSERLLGHGMMGTVRARSHIVTGESFRQSTWTFRTSEWKLVTPARDPNTGVPYPDHVGRPRSTPTLHRVGDPKQESVDVAHDHPEVVARLVREFESWLDSRLEGRPDPIASQGPSVPWAEFARRWQHVIDGYGDRPNRARFGAALTAQAQRFGER